MLVLSKSLWNFEGEFSYMNLDSFWVETIIFKCFRIPYGKEILWKINHDFIFLIIFLFEKKKSNFFLMEKKFVFIIFLF